VIDQVLGDHAGDDRFADAAFFAADEMDFGHGMFWGKCVTPRHRVGRWCQKLLKWDETSCRCGMDRVRHGLLG
jgi:hypothetical protein